MIVASILLAFCLDAWWDGRQEQAHLDEVLEAVADEFEAEIVVLDSIIVENEAGFEYLAQLLEATDPAKGSLSEAAIRDWGQGESRAQGNGGG